MNLMTVAVCLYSHEHRQLQNGWMMKKLATQTVFYNLKKQNKNFGSNNVNIALKGGSITHITYGKYTPSPLLYKFVTKSHHRYMDVLKLAVYESKCTMESQRILQKLCLFQGENNSKNT